MTAPGVIKEPKLKRKKGRAQEGLAIVAVVRILAAGAGSSSSREATGSPQGPQHRPGPPSRPGGTALSGPGGSRPRTPLRGGRERACPGLVRGSEWRCGWWGRTEGRTRGGDGARPLGGGSQQSSEYGDGVRGLDRESRGECEGAIAVLREGVQDRSHPLLLALVSLALLPLPPPPFFLLRLLLFLSPLLPPPCRDPESGPAAPEGASTPTQRETPAPPESSRVPRPYPLCLDRAASLVPCPRPPGWVRPRSRSGHLEAGIAHPGPLCPPIRAADPVERLAQRRTLFRTLLPDQHLCPLGLRARPLPKGKSLSTDWLLTADPIMEVITPSYECQTTS
nr:uncharacterized protein LOC111748944 [Loxodonta africana]